MNHERKDRRQLRLNKEPRALELGAARNQIQNGKYIVHEENLSWTMHHISADNYSDSDNSSPIPNALKAYKENCITTCKSVSHLDAHDCFARRERPKHDGRRRRYSQRTAWSICHRTALFVVYQANFLDRLRAASQHSHLSRKIFAFICRYITISIFRELGQKLCFANPPY